MRLLKLKIKFLKPFSDTVGKNMVEIDFNGNTLNDLLKVMIKSYPQLKKEFYTETKKLSTYLCIFINDKPLSALNGIHTKLQDGDELVFFVPVSGG
ncbi:hypothetical protein AYK25_05390 [Thermoplasmatales archaeon SM1-50]|nr:MAG: hypothetical protein AYK25_05390 [Thermoplasmatales archaeon SM1-50]